MPSSGVQTCALDRKSTRLNSSHTIISYAVFCLKKELASDLLLDVLRDRSVDTSQALLGRVEAAFEQAGPIREIRLHVFFQFGGLHRNQHFSPTGRLSD